MSIPAKRLKGVIVGAGYFSQFHFDAWSRIPEVQIVGICDTDGAKAQSVCDKKLLGDLHPNVQVYANASEMFDAEQPDFVDIISPPGSHVHLCSEAANRGIAILCQKALAPTLDQSIAIVDHAQRMGARLMVHDNFRFQPWHREIRRLIDAGAIGDRLHQLTFRCRMGDGWGDGAYLGRQPYFREMPRLLVFETGVHFIDTFRFLAGEIKETYSILRRWNKVIQGEDAGLLTFQFANGAIGVWDANRYNDGNNTDPRYTFGEFLIEGSEGTIRLYSDGNLTVQKLGQSEHKHAYLHERRGFAGDCVYNTARHFIECLESSHEFETSGEDYLRTLRVQEAVYLSAEQNRPVQIDEAAPVTLRKIVDLSLPINNQMPGVEVTPFTTIESKGWNTTTLKLYSHCGTHMDAPKHFLPDADAASINEQSLATCCGPAKLVNLVPVGPQELISLDRFLKALNDSRLAVHPGDRIVLRTDWSKTYGTAEYRNHLPRISPELARWLVGKRVAMVATEALSVADVNNKSEVTEVHHIFFRGGVTIVEGLTGLDQLKSHEFEFVALPMKIVDGDGSPVRAIAIERGW